MGCISMPCRGTLSANDIPAGTILLGFLSFTTHRHLFCTYYYVQFFQFVHRIHTYSYVQ